MDRVDKRTRSYVMSRIRKAGNKSTEWRLRSLLIRAGLHGWHVRDALIEGNPDFVFPEESLVVFVDGCFWHGCPRCFRQPKTRINYWGPKIEGNKRRDRNITRRLKTRGYRVLRFWEHDLRSNSTRILNQILDALASCR